MLVFFQYCFGSRYYELFVFPYSGYDELTVGTLADIHYCLAEYGRVADLILCNICVVRRTVVLFVELFRREHLFKYHDTYDHSYESERICDCACHGHVIGCLLILRIHLDERLLSGSQHRCVGYRSCEQSDGVRQGSAGGKEYTDSHQRSDQKEADGQKIELDATFLE